MRNKVLFELQAETCKAMSHPLRIEVIEILKEGEHCFSDILEKTAGLKSNLSQHISIMVNSGILKMRKDSRCNYYRLSSPKVAKACSMIRELMIDNLERHKKILMTI